MWIKYLSGYISKLMVISGDRLTFIFLFSISKFSKFPIINIYCFYNNGVISNIYVNFTWFIWEIYSHKIFKNILIDSINIEKFFLPIS